MIQGKRRSVARKCGGKQVGIDAVDGQRLDGCVCAALEAHLHRVLVEQRLPHLRLE